MSADDLRAYIGYRRQGRPAAPVDQAGRLRQWKAENEAANAQHLQDLSNMALPGQTPTPEQQEARQRAIEHVAGGMNIGGLTVWHGTPNQWAVPKFLKDKIGTGEGAQAYGMGHYVAEGEPTARSYRNDLSRDRMVEKLKEVNAIHNDYRDLQLRNIIEHGTMSPDEMNLLFKLRDDDWLGFDHPHMAVQAAMAKNWRDYEPKVATRQAARQLGSLYKVDLADSAVPQMLNWDKPLVQQPSTMSRIVNASNDPDKAVLRQALDNFGKHQSAVPGRDLGGGAFMNSLIGRGGTKLEDQTSAMGLAGALRDSGVPGVQYLDAMSRKGGGPGTSNFVVFPGNERLLSVLERNGQPVQDINSWGGLPP